MRIRNRFLLSVSLAVLISALQLMGGPIPSYADPPNGQTQAPQINEAISLPMNLTGKKWDMLTNEHKGSYVFQEFIPAGESGDNWSELVTVQTFGQRPDIDTGKFIGSVIARFTNGCGSSQVLEKGNPVEGPFQTFNALVVCKDSPVSAQQPNVSVKKYEVLWLKGIQGKLNAYVVQRAWHADSITADSILASSLTRQNWRHWISAVCVLSQRDGEKEPQRSCSSES